MKGNAIALSRPISDARMFTESPQICQGTDGLQRALGQWLSPTIVANFYQPAEILQRDSTDVVHGSVSICLDASDVLKRPRRLLHLQEDKAACSSPVNVGFKNP